MTQHTTRIADSICKEYSASSGEVHSSPNSVAWVAAKGGFSADLAASSEKPYPVRALWPAAHDVVRVADGVFLGVPGFLNNLDIAPYCKRLSELGYNAIVIGSYNDVVPNAQPGHWDAICGPLHAHGIEVFVKPTLAEGLYPHDTKVVAHCQHRLLQWLQNTEVLPDGVLWASKAEEERYHHNPKARDLLLYDLLMSEVTALQESLGDVPLLFYIPHTSSGFAARIAPLMNRLSDDVSPTTTLVFSSVAGLPQASWQALHPLWDVLRRVPDVSATPFLPICNAGLVGLGGGFWPLLATKEVDQVSSRMGRHHFAGAIHLANSIPALRGLSAASLWSAAQSLVYHKPAELMKDLWLEAYHPALRQPTAGEDFAIAHDIAMSLARLLGFPCRQPPAVTEWLRYSVDKVLAAINELKVRTDGDSDYSRLFLYFLRDARRIVVATAQRLGVPVMNAVANDDFKPGFWTCIASKPLTPSAFGDAVTIFDTPVRDVSDPFRVAIYDDNCL